MSVMTYTPSQTREQIYLENVPNCICDSCFDLFEHKKKRRKELLGVSIVCQNIKCQFNKEPLIAYSKNDVISSIDKAKNYILNQNKTVV